MTIQPGPDGMISIEQYEHWVRRFGTEDALISIARVSRALEFKDPILEKSILNRSNSVGQWQLAFFAKTLINKSNDYRAKSVDDRTLYFACNYYNNVRDPHLKDPDTEETRRELLNHLVRMSYEEFPFQIINHRADIPRALILFEQLAESAAGAGFDVASAFREVTGLTVREFLFNGFAFWANAGAGAIKTPLTTSILALQDTLKPENQERFLSIVSTDYATFRKFQDKQLIKDGYEKHQFNCLNSFPLIRTGRRSLLVSPIPLLLIRRITRGIYYYLQEAYSKGGDRNDFTQFFGKHLFEPYVGMQLRSLPLHTSLSDERDISRSEKSCDWILTEGNAVTLIECKTLGLTARAKAFAETEIVTDDLRKRIVKAVHALARTKEAIDKGVAGFESLRGKTTRNLIVLYDEVYLFNSLLYRELLQNDLKQEGLENTPFQVCSIAELEYAIPILGQTPLASMLDGKISDRERSTWDLSVHIDHLVSEKALSDTEPNKILDAKFEEVFASLR